MGIFSGSAEEMGGAKEEVAFGKTLLYQILTVPSPGRVKQSLTVPTRPRGSETEGLLITKGQPRKPCLFLVI